MLKLSDDFSGFPGEGCDSLIVALARNPDDMLVAVPNDAHGGVPLQPLLLHVNRRTKRLKLTLLVASGLETPTMYAGSVDSFEPLRSMAGLLLRPIQVKVCLRLVSMVPEPVHCKSIGGNV